MKLHKYKEEFAELSVITAKYKGLPQAAIVRDYYAVMMLQKLSESEFADLTIFKGGTSLSKCFPGSIERFSEDIDLTFLGMELPDKQCSRKIKEIEKIMTAEMQVESIPSERSNRSKSLFAWHDQYLNRIKLEIGSSVRPDPYSKRGLKTYIQEYLESVGKKAEEDIEKYELSEIKLNVLDITRTFIDKVMAVKRHTICGSLEGKSRHVYDVVKLYDLPEIKKFLSDKAELKRLIRLTKETDSYYIGKRNISAEYDPLGAYAFGTWKEQFTALAKREYKELNKTLLYSSESPDFDDAIEVFQKISDTFAELDE